MEFLLEADQENRRRIQIEELILLLLRCLAILLLALFLARPIYDPTGLGMFGETLSRAAGARVERIVVLDDSPSMDARASGSSPFDRARDALALDSYVFTREAYIQRRNFLIHDGSPPADDMYASLEDFEAELLEFEEDPVSDGLEPSYDDK